MTLVDRCVTYHVISLLGHFICLVNDEKDDPYDHQNGVTTGYGNEVKHTPILVDTIESRKYRKPHQPSQDAEKQ